MTMLTNTVVAPETLLRAYFLVLVVIGGSLS
jgi:hypothetical protein